MIVGVLVIACGAGAGPQEATPPAATEGATPTAPAVPQEPAMEPQQFLNHVARADALQIALAGLVKQHGEEPSVGKFAHRMATNCTAIEVIIRKVGKKASLEVVDGMDDAGHAVHDRLKDLRGLALDKAYIMWLAEDQTQNYLAYRWQYDNAKQEDVKSFVMQTLPIVGVHQRVSDELNKVVNKEEIRRAAEAKIAAEKAAEEKRIADAMAEAQKNARKQPPARKSMLKSAPKDAPPPASDQPS
jgi:predicted outer membrane protein